MRAARLDEAFGLAVGARGIGARAEMADSDLPTGLGELARVVAGSVVGKQAANGDAQTRVVGHGVVKNVTAQLARSLGSRAEKVMLRAERSQYHGTFFLRNRPQLELIRSLAGQKLEGSTLKIAVLACSNGAEVYSILWTIRSARPDLKLDIHAIDISDEILEIARKGVYSLGDNPMVHSAILERLTEAEMAALFDEEKDQVRIKPWIAEGIHWMVGDAAAPNLADHFGPADIVVANNFLCHMAPPDAERCLRNLARLVKPGGYLFASGIDLDVRTRVAIDLGWMPVLARLGGIHNGDPKT
jgi:chemotaxis methyl-accepting protein methylase